MNRFLTILFTAIGAVGVVVVLAVVLGLLLAWPIMLLWNGCLVPAFATGAVIEIGWLQAWGLNILSALLLRSSTSSSK